MKKSIYSLVLMDDVVRAVDEQAYRLGTSRSNLINQILAQHLSCVTPEMRMREIFDTLTAMAGGSFQVQERRSDSLMTLRTALAYKYRPTISYKVELDREPGEYLGRVTVSIRTQSKPLMELFSHFFVYRCAMEARYLERLGLADYSAVIGSNTFARRLFNSGKLSDEETGEAICAYIADLDRSLKQYLADPDGFAGKAGALESEYRKLLDRYVL